MRTIRSLLLVREVVADVPHTRRVNVDVFRIEHRHEADDGKNGVVVSGLEEGIASNPKHAGEKLSESEQFQEGLVRAETACERCLAKRIILGPLRMNLRRI